MKFLIVKHPDQEFTGPWFKQDLDSGGRWVTVRNVATVYKNHSGERILGAMRRWGHVSACFVRL